MQDALSVKQLAEFSHAVRESTLKRLRAVPEGFENWRITQDAMSFADIAQHLIDADDWLFKKLEVKDLEPLTGRSGIARIDNRDDYLSLLESLENRGRQRSELIESLTETQLAEHIYDRRFGGEVAVWWIIVRGNLDHEIHHRGQIAVYLRVLTEEGV